MQFTHRRILAPIATAAIVGLALAGCASSGGGSTGGGDLAGKTLDVEATWSGAEQTNFEAVLKKFEDDTGAKVNYTSFGDKGATTIGTQIEGGNPPDVAVVGQPALLQSLAKDGNIVELSSGTMATVKKNYSQSWIDLGTVEGKTYGVWFKASNKSTVWYNADIYDEAGAAVPKDWDDFLTQLQLVSDAG